MNLIDILKSINPIITFYKYKIIIVLYRIKQIITI